MPSAAGSLDGGWIPIVIGSSNFKADAGIFYNKIDSLYKKIGTDSVFSSTNGVMNFIFTLCDSCCRESIQQVTIAQLRSASPSSILSDFVYYIVDNYKQGFFRYESADVTSVDDGAMILVTINNKRFKRVVQDNVINARWFGAGDINGGSSISSLGLSYSQAQQIFNRASSPLVLTNYDYNNQNVNWFSLQRAINYCIESENGKLYIPAGNYTIHKGLFVGAQYGNFVTSFEMCGAATTYDGAHQTTITLDNNQSFAVGFHRCKGVRVNNLFVKGTNPLISLTFHDIMENDDPSIWINGCRANRESPHAGFIVDPIFDNNPDLNDTTEKYPDFKTLYTSTNKTGGSTDIIFDNCQAQGFIVGFCFSPHHSPQNGETMAVNNSWVSFCRSAISIGQSQNRSVYVNNFKAWSGIEVVFDCARFSDGRADHVEVNGVNIAGAVKYLTLLSGYFDKGLIIDRMHAESLLSLGGCFGPGVPLTGNLIINNSWIDFVGQDSGTGSYIHAADLIFQGRNLKVTNSYLIRYNGDPTPLSIFGNADFETCHFDYVPINTYPNPTIYYSAYYTNDRLSFTNCTSEQFTSPFGHGNFIKTGNAAEIWTSTYMALNNTEIHMSRYDLANLSYKRIVTENGNDMFQDYICFEQSNSVTFSALDTLSGTGTYTMTAGTNDYQRLAVGDYLFSYDNTRKTVTNSTVWFLLGKIVSKNDDTGDINLDHMARKVHLGTSYPIRVPRTKYLFPYFIVGDVTAGSTLITNVVEEAWLTGAPQGTIRSPYFPVGTYILGISGNTIYVSNKATASSEGADVVCGLWNAVEYGTSPDQYPFTCCNQAYRRGDIIHNIDITNYPDIEMWTCTKSGITGTARAPEFEITFRDVKKILPGNTSLEVGAGRFIANIIVNTAATTDYINIGTTPGGTEIAAAVPVTYNVDTTIPVNKYFRSNTTLYFTGLTSTLEIIIPK